MSATQYRVRLTDSAYFAHEWTGKGAIHSDEQAVNFTLGNAEETKGMTYAQLEEKPTRFIATDPESWNSDVEEGIAYTPFKHQLEKKRSGRTFTGRLQFYIDHPWYIELGEQPPTFKEPIPRNTCSTGTRRTDAGRFRIDNEVGNCICRPQILPGEQPGLVTMHQG